MTSAIHCGPLPALDRANVTTTAPGWLRRLFTHLMTARQRRADREIARFLAQNGFRLTDAAEREMMQRLFVNDWSVRR